MAPTGQVQHQAAEEGSIQDHNAEGNDSSQDSWNPEEILAAESLVEGACCDMELPNIQLMDAMLAHARQIEAKMSDELNEDLIWLLQSHAAECQMSDGNGGTLQMQMRQPCKGVNASDGEAYILELHHQV